MTTIEHFGVKGMRWGVRRRRIGQAIRKSRVGRVTRKKLKSWRTMEPKRKKAYINAGKRAVTAGILAFGIEKFLGGGNVRAGVAALANVGLSVAITKEYDKGIRK